VDGPADARALTLIHAGVANLRMWDEHVPVFVAAGHRVIRYDTRGFGRTQSEDVPFSNRDDLRLLLDHLDVGETALVGLSRGGSIALDFALENPDRVSALVIGATSPSGFEYPEPELDPIWAEMERLEGLKDWDAVVELETRLWTDGLGQPPDRVAPGVRERVRAWDRDNYREQGHGQPQPLDPPAVGRLGEIHVPALIVWGDLDVPGVPLGGEAMVAGIRGARKHVFAGAAHMLNLEQPDAFERLVLDFLSEAGVGG
jgi:pimeloyl-ACP methyl ester carboxylesterase